MRFHFATPVWGAGHLGLFLEIGLPSLLAPGNLPGLSEAAACRFRIYTRPEDEPALTAAPVFRRLASVMPVDVQLIRELILVPHRTMSDCHIDAMRRADEADVAAVFVPPDCVWADGSLVRLERLAEAGKSVVHMSGIRLDRDAVLPRLLDHRSADGAVLAIPPRPLVALGLAHLHTIAYGHFWNEHEGGLMPANLYWTVPGEGLLVRCFHLHPLMVRSQVKFSPFASTIDDDLALRACPDVSRDHVVADSDELLAFELSGPERVVNADFRKGSAESAACWAEIGTNPRHHTLVRHAIRLHAGPVTEALWQPVEAAAERVVQEIQRIHHSSVLRLALRHRAVLWWRFYQLSRNPAPGQVPSWRHAAARFALRSVMWLLRWRNALYAGLLLYDGEPRLWHPGWLVRRTTVAGLLAALGPADRQVVLLGGDPGLARRLERARPGLAVTALAVTPAGAAPADAILCLDPGDVPADRLLDTIGRLDRDGSRRDGGRIVVARFAPAADPAAERLAALGPGIELRPFGPAGSRFCRNALLLLQRGRTRLYHSPWRLLVKLLLLLASPLLLPLIMLGALALNLAGLAADALDRGGLAAAGPPPPPGRSPRMAAAPPAEQDSAPAASGRPTVR